MKNKFLKLIACLLAAVILVSVVIFPAAADENASEPTDAEQTVNEQQPDENSDETQSPDSDSENEPEAAPEETPEEAPEGGEDENSEQEEAPEGEEGEDAEQEEQEDSRNLTDEEEIERCKVVAENSNLILYLDEEYERIGLYVKASGAVHWSNCVNALTDDATSKPATKQNRLSNLAVIYGNATDLITSSYLYSYRTSTHSGDTVFETVENGVKITYQFEVTRTVFARIPVYFILHEDYLDVYINTSEIEEPAGYKDGEEAQDADKDVIILDEVAILPFMSAGTPQDNGYMLIPDGSGARINLNNGKGNYSNYSAPLYGRDITKVRDVQADDMEQATLPVMAMVKESDGLVMIATDGDTFATVNSAVSYNKADQAGYNYCYFSFTLRSTDDYSMAGEASIKMIEKGDGKIPVEKLAVRYYPITSENEEVSYAEIADVYRNYLINEKGFTKKTQANRSPLFINYFGGTLKSKSILGVPIAVKTSYTTFNQAVEITSKLKELGVDQMVVNYNDWTNDSMSSKIDTADSVAGCLGGKSDFKDMMKYFSDNGVDFYATVDGYTFKSNGNGFWTLFDTAYRVSKSYSRQSKYNLAYGTPEHGVAPALLAPKSISKLAGKVSKNLSKLGLTGAGLGSFSTTLWSDFSNKNHTNRAVTAQYIIDYYSAVKEKVGKMIADAPNAYLLPYVDAVKNLPVQSSQFKVVDADVPFVQILLHGYTDYATKAVNGSPDSKTLFLKAIAAGSNIEYDFIYNKATKLVNTDYVNLYYATYDGWLEQAAKEYELANEILSKVSDAQITDYKQEGSIITTTYSNGTVTVVDLDNATIKANGKTYKYSDYVEEGGLR